MFKFYFLKIPLEFRSAPLGGTKGTAGFQINIVYSECLTRRHQGKHSFSMRLPPKRH